MRGFLQRPSRRRSDRAGASLVEIMVACLILAVIAVGTAACLYYSRAQMNVQRNRRTAMELATSRLEETRAAMSSQLLPSSQNYNINYLDRITGSWRVGASDQGETVKLNGQSRPMITTVQYVDADGGSASYDCLRITASVRYDSGPRDWVTLQTMRAQ